MLKQIRILTKLELCNLYGRNVFRFLKDKRERRKKLALGAVYLVLIGMMMLYVGSMSFGLAFLGLQEVVPAYLIIIASLLTFFFCLLKAGAVLFRREGYDQLCALPLSKGVVAVSRLLKMYVEYLLLTLAVFIPGMAVYAWTVKPGASFYMTAFLGLWSIPVIPMTAASVIGTVITGISSRMRHRSMIVTALSFLAMLGMMWGVFKLSAMEGEFDPEMLTIMYARVMGTLEKVYPPAVWLGSAIVRGNILYGICGCALSLAVFAAAAGILALCFRQICEGLFSGAAGHDYRMGAFKTSSVPAALCRREFQRYFSSSVYVTNTLMGPIMACVFSGALLAAGGEKGLEGLFGMPVPVDMAGIVPFVLAGMFGMMTPAAVSISMEGKNWWILKSLPLTMKNILDGKILMNVLLMLPFYLLSEVLLILAFRPGILELLFLLLIPAEFVVFSAIYGIAVNLRFPVFVWESEVSVVKQSASALFGGLGGFLLAVVCGVGTVAVPVEYALLFKAGVSAVILFAALLLYCRNNRRVSDIIRCK